MYLATFDVPTHNGVLLRESAYITTRKEAKAFRALLEEMGWKVTGLYPVQAFTAYDAAAAVLQSMRSARLNPKVEKKFLDPLASDEQSV